MKVRPPKHVEHERLLHRRDEDDVVNFDDMVPYDPDRFMTAVEEHETTTFYVLGPIDGHASHLAEKKLTFRPMYRDPPDSMSAITVYKRHPKAAIRIKSLPTEAKILHSFCKDFSKRTGFKLEYKGEAQPTLINRAIHALLISQRIDPGKAIKKQLLKEQKGLCVECGDTLGKKKFEVCHRTPLAKGGSNELDNLDLKCPFCHGRETQAQDLETRGHAFHTLQSQLSPGMKAVWGWSAKPSQEYWGSGPPEGVEEVLCLDTVSCRQNALFRYQHPLPIYSPMDEMEPAWVDGTLVNILNFAWLWVDCGTRYDDTDPREIAPYEGAHLYPLGAVQIMLDAKVIELEDIKHGWRPTRTLEPRKLEEACRIVKTSVEASVREHMWWFDDASPMFPKTKPLTEKQKDELVEKQQKKAILSWIGLCNGGERRVWVAKRGWYEDDVGGAAHTITHDKPGEAPLMKVPTMLLDNKTLGPIVRIALFEERIHNQRQRILLAPYIDRREIQLLGCLVDGHFFRVIGNAVDVAAMKADLTRHEYPNGGGKIYAVKDEPAVKIRKCDQRETVCESDVYLERQLEWTTIRETDAEAIAKYMEELGVTPYTLVELSEKEQEKEADGRNALNLRNLAKIVAHRQGACVCGPAGVGKTWFSKMIDEEIFKIDKDAKIHPMALTHVAARLTGGSTIAHALHRYKRVRGAWIKPDEFSMIPLCMLGEMSRWHLMGCKFVFLGDSRGQFMPIYDQWKDVDMRKAEHSHLMTELCQGLKVELTVYRRGIDHCLFDFYFGLCDRDLDDKTQCALAVAEARDRYPWNEREAVDHFFVLSHKKRLVLNHLANLNDTRGRTGVVFVKKQEVHCSTAPSQDMLLYKDMERPLELIGCTRQNEADVVNGVIYSVVGVDSEYVNLRMTDEFRKKPALKDRSGHVEEEEDEDSVIQDEAIAREDLRLTHAEVSKTMRLTYALCYASIQGRTLKDRHILLLDTMHREYFTMRHLIVGVSRATHGQFVHLPTLRAEFALVKRARESVR